MSTIELIDEGARSLSPTMAAEVLDFIEYLKTKVAKRSVKAGPGNPEWEARVKAYLASPADWEGECPLCEYYNEPNAETIAAFEEGDAMERGEIPSHNFKTLDEFWDALD
jgi:hypothetical protein